MLKERYPLVASGPDYLVYDLRPTTLTLSRTELHFAAVSDGTVATGPQEFRLLGGATSDWTVSSSLPSIFSAEPKAGRGHGTIRVSLVPGGGSGRGRSVQGTISVRRLQTDDHLRSVNVVFKPLPTTESAAPIGSFDAPDEGSEIRGGFAVMGWALDDIEVVRVQIYRDAVDGENDRAPILVGETGMAEDVRPDVEKIYGDWPLSYRAAWGYSVDPGQLPNGGNGQFTFRVYAEDREGRRTELGVKRVRLTNP